MKTLFCSADLPEQLDGFAGGMGHKAIQSFKESDLCFDPEYDVKGYISEPVDGVYYGEVIDSEGNSEYACGNIDEIQKWTKDTVYEYCKMLEDRINESEK